MAVSESRTAKSLKNAKVALCFYFINLVLQFFSRKIFLDYLGAEVLGLNTTAQNLLGFLNLAELGIGSAVAYNLYKPLFEKDTQAINEIVSVQGWLYRRVAYAVIAGACVLMCFFPLIFAKAQVPLWYTYGSFIVLLVGALLGYFINYRQIVLTADQKEYKITLNVQGFKILKVILQILAIRYLSNGYVYWMILELLFSATAAVVLDKVLKREYPWLKSSPMEGRTLRTKYPEIITKTKQVFFHQIGHFALTQTSPLIIYAFASLTLVAIYGNYMLIVTGVTLLMNSLLNSVSAGIGSLVAEGDKKRIIIVFDELFSIRFLLVSVICYCVYRLAPMLITLWVGRDFLLSSYPFYLIIIIMYINLMRSVVDSFVNAYGLFQDIWAPIVEATLNIGLSVIAGFYWGISGVLGGVLCSLILIVFCWKPYFLFTAGIKYSLSHYCMLYLKHLVIGISVWFFSDYVLDYIAPNEYTYTNFFISCVETMSIYGFITGLFIYCFNPAMRHFIARFICEFK